MVSNLPSMKERAEKFPARGYDAQVGRPNSKMKVLIIFLALSLVAGLIFVVLNYVVGKSSDTYTTSSKRYSAQELKEIVTQKYDWKVFWVGPRDSKEFKIEELVDGVVQITYIPPNGIALPDTVAFVVYSARTEADRLKTVRHINPLVQISATTPAGNEIVYTKENMARERVYLRDGGIGGFQFPAAQSLEMLMKMADKLMPLN